MGESVLSASIKKIEIVNKTKKDEWQQSVRIILGDIELNNENFIALRRFRPDEMVNVSIESAQISLFEEKTALAEGSIVGSGAEDEGNADDLFSIEEGDMDLKEGEYVQKEFTI